jgi:hypothetical protein
MYSHNNLKYKVRCKYNALGTQQMPKPDTCADDAVVTMLVGPGLLVDLRQYAAECQLRQMSEYIAELTRDP